MHCLCNIVQIWIKYFSVHTIRFKSNHMLKVLLTVEIFVTQFILINICNLNA